MDGRPKYAVYRSLTKSLTKLKSSFASRGLTVEMVLWNEVVERKTGMGFERLFFVSKHEAFTENVRIMCSNTLIRTVIMTTDVVFQHVFT